LEENKNTIEELKKIRIDCMYGKRKHYNARGRYVKYYKMMGLFIVGLTAFMGTSVFYSISENAILGARIITGIITVAVAVLAALQTFFNFEKESLRHKVVADKYLWLMKKSQRLISYYNDGNKTGDDIIKETEEICLEIKDIQKDEPEVSKKDYKKAKEGIKNGEEAYTEAEKEI
jgi:hypothetical protein